MMAFYHETLLEIPTTLFAAESVVALVEALLTNYVWTKRHLIYERTADLRRDITQLRWDERALRRHARQLLAAEQREDRG
jgi:hypothetical protein